MTITTPTKPTADAAAGYADVPDLRIFVFALFFIFGGITSLNDVVIPKLKSLFTLTYGQVMLVQFAFFMAYFVVSLPAAAIVRRVGYMRTAAIGLLAMTAGCLLFAAGYFYLFSKTHVGILLIQGLFLMVFFLYLVRQETRARLR